MLVMRPWSAYELSNEVRDYLSQCLGRRAETSIYQEPKKLVEHGFARAKIVAYGRRTRTVYSITPKGRRALRRWLDQPSAPPAFEVEALARTVFAEYGSREALLRTLTQLEHDVAAMRQKGTALSAQFLGKVGVNSQRVGIAGVALRLYFDNFALLENWARWARSEVEAWPEEWPELTPEQAEGFRMLLTAMTEPPEAPTAPGSDPCTSGRIAK